MFWFDKNDARAVFMDMRNGEFPKDFGTPQTKGRRPVVVKPDVTADFTAIPFPSESFSLVVFDPPHHTNNRMGNTCSIQKNCYGVLLPGWEEMIEQGFRECFRVLKPSGVLIFKWCSKEIPLKRIMALTPEKPLFGHKSGRQSQTHWLAFIKVGV